MSGAGGSRTRRVVGRIAAIAVLTLVVFAGVLIAEGWTAFGNRATGARLERMAASPEWRDGQFVNPQPLENHLVKGLLGIVNVSENVSPRSPLPAAYPTSGQFAIAPASGLRVTWLGHSSTLVEIDGVRVLTDPIWSDRASPVSWLGPRRWNEPLIPLDSLPHIDAVVISHDHYDHLDYGTIRAMREWKTTFVVPLGIGAHLAAWGIPESRIVELDWWQRTTIGSLEIVSTPSRHASGRILFDNDAKLWSGFALISAQHRVYYSGDTGLFPALRDIGERLGPFDLTMIEVGQYGQAWPDWHLGPEQAVRAHRMVKGRVMLPVHWGLFALAYHGWTEPVERALAAAATDSATLIAPRPGQSVEPTVPQAITRWWPVLPWKTGAQDPIVATKMQ